MTREPLADRLRAARARFEEVSKRLRRKWQADTAHAYWQAEAEVLRLERELAAANSEEHAVPLDFPVKWDAGAPLPQLLTNDYRTLLAFVVRDEKPASGAPDSETAEESLALVEFDRCLAAKLGSPNDEVFHGHPLQGRGLDPYTAQRVVNSRWLLEIESVNKVHHRFDPTLWTGLNHYVFWFRDTTFECVARSFSVEVFREPMPAMLARMCQRAMH